MCFRLYRWFLISIAFICMVLFPLTVYIVEESPTYLDYGVFEFDPFGEGAVIQ